ncbi:hypothetical protein KY290_034578 [Solanum tuberosum]|uniref:Uncharacterized protein n=1 Tax=Solanum tuberosum TaxID=4113 RepID=A0ABQ7U3R7_SOLTU|nr:hypothetical protein KY290_034578 [Solanum tuberosum]
MEYGHAQRSRRHSLPLSIGLAVDVTKNIEDYMVEKLGIEQSKIVEQLAICYNFDYDEYHSFVHGGLPYEKLRPDPILRSLLLSLPIRKVAGSVLPKTPILCKPSQVAIERALDLANIINPHTTLFFEDSVRNVQASKRVGLDTVLVGKSQKVVGADYALESIHNIKEILPQLWEVEKVAEVTYSGVAVETSVIA